MVTGLFAGQHNTKLHGTIIGVIWISALTWSGLDNVIPIEV